MGQGTFNKPSYRRLRLLVISRKDSDVPGALGLQQRREIGDGSHRAFSLESKIFGNFGGADWIQNVLRPADTTPPMSQLFAEMKPSSGLTTFKLMMSLSKSRMPALFAAVAKKDIER